MNILKYRLTHKSKINQLDGICVNQIEILDLYVPLSFMLVYTNSCRRSRNGVAAKLDSEAKLKSHNDNDAISNQKPTCDSK